VADLAGQVRAVVSGERVRSVAVDGPREIAQLGADIEAMRLRIVRDLDESREVNRLLDEQARELERSNRDLEQFAYVASHDLQEPLRKISSFCQLLQRRYGGQLDDRADQYIGFAVDGAQRMQQLINDLLSFSRVGRTTESFVPVPLGDVVAAARNQLDSVREETGGEIAASDLPVVDGDPALLRQLFVNVLGNGLKFHRDGVPPVVRVDARRGGSDGGSDGGDDRWEITVADNGIGLDAEYAEKVFVIFQRLHARDRYPGTGIGLALAKKIAEFHGGRIRIEPTEGPGATIALTLPASAGRPDPDDR
jgi:light-regulated signal transduction histidine kinase (bacteriophytochrome)